MESKRAKLSRSLVDHATPSAKPYRLWDTKLPGLFLRVQPSGAKSWNVQWARRTSKVVGRYPIVTLDGAHQRARAMLAEVDKDGKPASVATREALTLAAYIAKEYGPWVQANRKDGKATVARLESTFATFLNRPLLDVTAWIVEKWRSKRLKQGAAPSTVNRDLTALRGCLSKAVEWGFLDVHPLAKVKPCKVDTNGRVRYTAPAEAKALRAALATRDAKVGGNGQYRDHLTPWCCWR